MSKLGYTLCLGIRWSKHYIDWPGESGKIFVLQKIAKSLCSGCQIVDITCTTGIAAKQYEKAQSMHSWFGVSGDGIQKSELSKLLVKDERYKKTKECIITGDVLIIDECSMLRRKKFDTVEFVCWYIRGTEQYFGGTQVILSSDSNQFPPVQDH